MGYLSKGQCFASHSEALDRYYSDAMPEVLSGSTAYQTLFTKSGSTWMMNTYKIAANGNQTMQYSTPAPVPNFPVCDQSADFFDGMTVGWGIAAAMIAVYSLKMIGKAR